MTAVATVHNATAVMGYVTDVTLIVTCEPRAAGSSAAAAVDDPATLLCDVIQ
jgi:hypothetical protein